MSEIQMFSIYLYVVMAIFWLAYLAMGSINYSYWRIDK